MPNIGERKRLKDRIIERVSKAVKQIQRLHGQEEVTVLTNDDWQFQKLVEHLDHALLHGLKHITNGYWVLVKEFTPKTTVKEIDRLTNVTTNLGRGRAWLYLALADQLLESYLNCYVNNQARVRKFYVKDALVLDQDQMHVLLTVSMGLEFVTFQLDVDKPYLDLASHVRLRTSSVNEDDDSASERLSIASMSSQLSLSSCNTPEMGVEATSLAEFDTTSNTDSESEAISFSNRSSRMSTDFSSSDAIVSSLSRIDRISSIQPNIVVDLDLNKELDNQDGAEDLEVIRMKVKAPPKSRNSKTRNQTKTKKNDSESLSSVDMESGVDNKKSSKSSLENVSVDNGEIPGNTCSVNDNSDETDFDTPKRSVMNLNKDLSTDSMQNLSDNYLRTLDLENSITLSDDSGTASHMSVDTYLPPETSLGNTSGNESCDFRDTTEQIAANEATISSQNSCDITADNSQFDSSNDHDASFEGVYDDVNNSFESSLGDSGKTVISNPREKSKDTVSKNGVLHLLETTSHKKENPKAILPGVIHEEGKAQSRSLKPKDTECGVMKMLCPWDLKVDNNAKLLLMLEVFQAEDEYFLKMFSTCMGHTEGDIQPRFVVLTDRALYITTKTANNKFKKEAVVNFEEIDYISLSLGYQVLNIVCTNRRKQFWITTGDELLTKCLMGHLDNAIRHSERDMPRLSILTDATNQRIALQKYVAAETGCKKSEVNILHYALVYWEDVETSEAISGFLSVGVHKQGFLQYKSHDYYQGYKAPVWKTGWFVLKEGSLYLYKEQHDTGHPLLTVNLSMDECAGCRMNRDQERANCLELLYVKGGSLVLCGSSLSECQDWLQSLCQAVASHLGTVTNKGVIVPCCCVLTRTRLFMCHEDVQTGFLRTLGSANIMDISAVLTDTILQHFCVLKFNAPNVPSPEEWVVYFNCVQGRDNFLQTLEEAWKTMYQVPLSTSNMEDETIRKKYKEGLKKIRQQRA